MINLGRIEMINEMVVIALPIEGESDHDYQYQVRWIDGPEYYKRKKGEVTWTFTTEFDFAKNVKSDNLIDWKQAPSQFIDSIKGGLADSTNPSQYNPIELEKGIKVEMEHTNDPTIATEIAMDHLLEDPDYYNKLSKIHERVQRRGNKWVLLSKKGKVLGTHDTKKDALKQERAIWASYK
jgi:predicted metallo-beta-lactamase superfamily hydrolase